MRSPTRERCAHNRDRHRYIIVTAKGVAFNNKRSELFLSSNPGISPGFLFGVTRQNFRRAIYAQQIVRRQPGLFGIR